MLEGILASVIERLAGKYVDGIDRKATELSVWRGEILLKDLSLKQTALDDLDLPVTLVAGKLEELRLDIPWKNLRSKPVIVKIKGLNMILSPNTNPKLSAEEKQKREMSAKKDALGEFDISLKYGFAQFDDKVHISQIHVRYEDSAVHTSHPFSAGMLLSHLAIESTNANWKPAFVENQTFLNKLCNLKGFSIYLNSDEKMFWNDRMDLQEFLEGFSSAIDNLDELAEDVSFDTKLLNFIIKPVDSLFRMRLNKSEKLDETHPKYDAMWEINRLELSMQKQQYRDVIYTMEYFRNFERIARYNQFRPHVSVKDCPKEWWLFAFNCIAWERNQRMLRFDKKKVFRLIMQWPRYAFLYRKKLLQNVSGAPCQEEEIKELENLEEILPLDALLSARKAVIAKLRAMEEAEQRGVMKDSSKPSASLYTRVSSWMPGFMRREDAGESEAKQSDYPLSFSATAEIMNEFGISEESYSDTGYKEEALDESKITRMRLGFILRFGSVTVSNPKSPFDDDRGQIAKFKLRDLEINFIQKATSFACSLQIGNLSCFDLCSPNIASGFDCVVSRFSNRMKLSPSRQRFASRILFPASITSSVWDVAKSLSGKASGGSKTSPSKEEEPALLVLKYESNPSEGEACDSRMVAMLDRMIIVYNPIFLRHLLDFIDIGESPALEALKRTAAEQLQHAKEVSEQNFKTALQAKIVADLSFDLRSPVIIIPQNVEHGADDCPSLVVQPGNLAIWSLKSSNMSKLSPLLQKMEEEDDVDERLYNSILLELSEVYMMICKRDQCWEAAKDAASYSNLSLINNVRISVCVDNSIAPSNQMLTRTKIKVALPTFECLMSQQKYSAIFEIWNNLFGSQDVEDTGTSEISGIEEKDTSREDFDEIEFTTDKINFVEEQWKHLDVSVRMADEHPIALKLVEEDDIGSSQTSFIALCHLSEACLSFVQFSEGFSSFDFKLKKLHVKIEEEIRDVMLSEEESNVAFSYSASFEQNHSRHVIQLGKMRLNFLPEVLSSIISVFRSSSGQTAVVEQRPADDRSVSSTSRGQGGARRSSGQRNASVQDDHITEYHVFLEEQKVFFFEDVSKPSERRVIVTVSGLIKDMSKAAGHRKGVFHLQDVQTFLEQGGEHEERRHVLHPTSLSLEYVLEGEKSSKLWLVGSCVDLLISYQDVLLYLDLQERILRPFSSPPAVTEREEGEGEEEGGPGRQGMQQVEDLRVPGYDRGELEHLQTQKQVRVDFDSFNIVVINDCAGFNEPFLSLSLSELQGMNVNAFDGESWGMVKFRTRASLFNSNVFEFEPLIESWELMMEKSQKIISQDTQQQDDDSNVSEAITYSLSSSDEMNLNIAENHLATLLSTLLTWKHHFPMSRFAAAGQEEEESPVKQEEECESCAIVNPFSAYAIKNRCGAELCIQTFQGSSTESPLVQTIRPMQSEPIHFPDKLWKQQAAYQGSINHLSRVNPQEQHDNRVLKISVVDDSLESLPGLAAPVDHNCFSIDIEEAGLSFHQLGDGARVLANVQGDDEISKRVVTIHSDISFTNDCFVAIRVSLSVRNRIVAFHNLLRPKETVDLPPQFVLDSLDDYVISMHPVLEDQDQSSFEIGDADLEAASLPLQRDLDKVVCCRRDLNHLNSFYLRVVAHVASLLPEVPGKQAKRAGEAPPRACERMTIALLPILMVQNFLPCQVRMSFLLDGDVAPQPSYEIFPGEQHAIHELDLSRRISAGFSVCGLEEGSEFVPVFCPDGSQLETNVTMYDSRRDILRIFLEHSQTASQIFRINIFAHFWFVNRTTYPLQYGQKWTASNVTLLGGQGSHELEGRTSFSSPPSVKTVNHSSHSCDSAHLLHDALTSTGILPTPFSFHWKVDVGGSKVTMRLGPPFRRYDAREGLMVPCDWSSSLSIDSVGSSTPVTLVGDGFSVDVIVSVALVKELGNKTKLVSILPRFVLWNRLEEELELLQVGVDEAERKQVEPGQVKVIAWSDESPDRRLRLRMLSGDEGQSAGSGQEAGWSSGVSLLSLGYSSLKLPKCSETSTGADGFINVTAHALMQGNSMMLVMKDRNEKPALLVKNETRSVTIAMKQADVKDAKEETIQAGEVNDYSWDDPHMPPILHLRFCLNSLELSRFDCNVDRLGRFPPITIQHNPLDVTQLHLSVHADGPTKILKIQDEKAIEDSKLKAKRPKRIIANHFIISLSRIGISIIDSIPSELIYLSLHDLNLKYVEAGDCRIVDLSVQHLQIDNQTSSGSPVVLGPYTPWSSEGSDAIDRTERIQNRSRKAENLTSSVITSSSRSLFLQVSVVQNLGNETLDVFDRIDVSFSDFSISADESLVLKLFGVFRSLISHMSYTEVKAVDNSSFCEVIGKLGALDLSSVDSSPENCRWIYVEQIRILPLKVTLTFHGSEDAHGLLKSLGPVSKLPVFAFVEALKAVVSNVDGAPIVLTGVEWVRPFLPREELLGRVVKHYLTDVSNGFYRLIGSLEFLGNPTGLVSNISQGVSAFIGHSREGLKEGHIAAMGRGLALGAGSLAAGTVQGVFGSASGLSNAMVKGLAQLTFDGDYKRARTLMDHDRPMHMGQGVLRGGKSLGRGVVQGFTGIFYQPIKGFSRDGTRGAIKGVGKGLVGFVVKPMAGMVDMVAYTTEGIKNTPAYISRRKTLSRIRYPRYWPAGSSLKGYDQREAMGLAMYKHLCVQEGWTRGEKLIQHAAWKDSKLGCLVLFISDRRLILCNYRFHANHLNLPSLSIKRVIDYADLSQLRLEDNRIDLQYENQTRGLCCSFNRRVAKRATSSLVLNIHNESFCKWLLLQIEVAVRQHRGLDLPEDIQQGWNSRRTLSLNVLRPSQAIDSELLQSMEIRIRHAKVQDEGFVMYGIQLSLKGERWTVYKRYSDFVKMKREVVKLMKSMKIQETLEIPPKRWMGASSSKAVVRERMQGLQRYLRKVLEIGSNQAAVANLLTSFLQCYQQ